MEFPRFTPFARLPATLLGLAWGGLSLEGACSMPLALDGLVVNAPSEASTAAADMADYGAERVVVEREHIERAGPGADVSRVLQMYVPGLFVAPKNGPFDYGTYSLQGSRSDDILILLDGVRLNNRLYGGLYLDTLPTTAVERIEVLKGGQGILFGTQAVAGVINIVTREARGREPSGQLDLGVDSLAGRGADARAERILENGLGDLGLLGYASRHRSEGYRPYRDRDMSDTVSDTRRGYDVTTLGAKAIQGVGETARLALFYQYTGADLDFARPTGNRETRNDRVHQIATATWTQRLGERLGYFVTTHLNDWDTRYTRVYNLPDGGTSVLNDGDYWGFRDWGVQLEGKARLPGDHDLLLGSDHQWYRGQDDVLRIDDNEARAHALYAQLRPRVAAAPDWHPSLGVRREALSGGEGATVWMLTSRYDLNPTLALRGQYGTAFKLPNAEQLYVNEPGSEIGDPSLRPERSRNAELGFDVDGALLHRPFQGSATLFRRAIADLIALDGERWVNGNGRIEVRGVDVNGRWQPRPGWQVSADLTRNLIETREGVTVNNIPTFFARARLGYDSPDGRWGAGGALRYIGRQENPQGEDYGRYSVVDADAYRYLDEGRHHRLGLLLENLLDRDYATGTVSNGMRQVANRGRPRTAELRYTLSF